MSYRPLADAPSWFLRALAVPQGDLEVEVDGCTIHALTFGAPGSRGLVFVHGGGAHAHWWTHVAATFSDEYRVVCIDLSGHGDRVSGAIVCDSPVTEPDPEIASYRLKEAFGQPRIYPTEAEAFAHFRTVPAQDHYLDYVMHHVAHQSIRPTEGGVQWKFDRDVFAQFGGGMRSVALPYLSRVQCRFALLRSEHGLVTPDIGRFMYETLGRVTPVIEIPEAGHHAMLDQPLILLTALRTLLGDWDHSEPRRRS